MRGVSRSIFWGRVQATDRVARLKGARFPDDTPARRAMRRARALLYPESFNATYLPHYFREGAAPFHVQIYRTMIRERRLCVRAPRGHAKSTILTFAWPVHQVACATELRALAEGRLEQLDARLADAIQQLREEEPGQPIPPWEPYTQIIALKDDLATEFTASIQAELLHNDLLAGDWTGLQNANGNQDEGDWVINDCRVKAFGMEGDILGGKHGPWRPFRAILDDPDGKRTTSTPRFRDQQEATLSSQVEYGLEPERGAITMVGTSVGQDCLVRRVDDKERYPEWKVLVFLAIQDDGTALWPERFNLQALRAMQEARPEYFAKEMMDTPPIEGGKPFHTIHRYSRLQWRDEPLGKVLAFDPALGRKATSDYQAVGVVRGPTPEGRVLIHRIELLRIGDPWELVGRVNQIVAEESPDVCVIEAIGFQILLKLLLAMDEAARDSVLTGWVEILRQEESKDLRIRGMAPSVNEGIYQFPDDKSCAQLERQFLEQPVGKKDGPDVIEMAIRHLREGARKDARGWMARHLPARRAHFGHKGSW